VSHIQSAIATRGLRRAPMLIDERDGQLDREGVACVTACMLGKLAQQRELHCADGGSSVGVVDGGLG
jgi:hypothetical protein